MLSCEMWSVLHADEWWETSNAPRNWCSQWISTDLIWCHPLWPGWAVKVDMFWQLTMHPNIRETETEWERDCLKPLIKTHSFIQLWSSVFGYRKCMGSEQLHERGLFCIKNKLLFSAYLQPLVCFVFLQWCCICRENNHLSDMHNV